MWHLERGEPRLFLQGLIQICAGFHHFQNGNSSGAVALLQRGADKMRKYPDLYLGFDVAAILVAVDAFREHVQRMQANAGPGGSVRFPKIWLGS